VYLYYSYVASCVQSVLVLLCGWLASKSETPCHAQPRINFISSVRKGEPGKEGPEGDQTRRRKDRPELRKRVHPHQVLPASGRTITVFRYVGACILFYPFIGVKLRAPGPSNHPFLKLQSRMPKSIWGSNRYQKRKEDPLNHTLIARQVLKMSFRDFRLMMKTTMAEIR
jgi:hypothetical protein